MRVVRSQLWFVLPMVATVLLLGLLGTTWAARVPHPFDLEWMEGGMLAHAWRLNQGLPLYVAPSPDFVPFVYPPGYSVVVALLGKFAGISLPLGRVLSLCSCLGAAALLALGVQRQSGHAIAGIWAGVAFLGAFPSSGAFYDLVRPDSLALMLLALSLVLAMERFRGAAEAAGLVLACSFLVKHNGAAFGLPIALGLWARDGWRVALRFAFAAAGPALAMTGLLQWRSDGHFLAYLVDVPASHPRLWQRVIPGLPRELGTALPVALAFASGWLVLRRVGGRWSVGVLVAGPILVGIATGMWQASYGHKTGGTLPLSSGVGAWAIGAAVAAVLLTIAQGVGRMDRLEAVSWRWVMGIGVACVALAVAALMRAHNGGYLNVYIPLHWVVCLGFGVALGRTAQQANWRWLAAVAATTQLVWSAGSLDRERLTPKPGDAKVGHALVEALAQVDGPVLSPFASWLPVQAGHDPSIHMIAIWDLDHNSGPYKGSIQPIEEAISTRYFGAVVQGSQGVGHGVRTHYRVDSTPNPGGAALVPTTGWAARPVAIMLPRSPE
jgi:hypothetical protein